MERSNRLERREEETNRTARILEIVQLIATRPKQFRASDLAQRFEISERMVKKDIQIIRNALKLALFSSKSGYHFEEMPQLPAVNYGYTEALALLQAAQVARRVSGIDSADLSAAIARLEMLFPTEFRPLLQALNQRPTKTVQREHRQQMLRLLNRALLEGKKLEIVYETASRDGAIGERVVHPYHIMPYVRSWQLIAHCEKRNDVIMFKVDRIHRATLLEEGYKVAADFDADEYMGNAWGVIRGKDLQPEEILLHFTPEAGRWVVEEYWHSSQEVETQEDGSVLFRLHIPITPEFVNWLLYYGSRVKVLEPPHLCNQVAHEHLRAHKRYEE
ncbi:WYL domain-containing protein [bacterium]|nr:WYL domain-containing protein [bacterium]